jgi:hypothetical protein
MMQHTTAVPDAGPDLAAPHTSSYRPTGSEFIQIWSTYVSVSLRLQCFWC